MAQPQWITPVGSLGVIPEGIYYKIPIQASAGGQDVYFRLISGELPAGIQVTSNGFIEGIPRTIVDVKGVPAEVSADVTSKFYAKDMHSGERALIERNIRDTMMEILGPKGFIVENVLLKSISLPQGLSAAIEEKLRAEQEAQRMEFTKQREKLEAERKAIAAEGDKQAAIIGAQAQAEVAKLNAEGQAIAIKLEAEAKAKANELLTKTLTQDVLKNNQIEAFKLLSQSANTKVIITDGKTPLIGIPDVGK
jgi:regulator of protease activity HflC (stomatin/prohibitin superfamily)